jgi:streptogramin lyase
MSTETGAVTSKLKEAKAMKRPLISAILIFSAVCAVGQQRVITEYSLTPVSAAGNVCLQPGGDVWFVFNGTSAIGAIASDGTVTSFAVPTLGLLVPGLVGCAFGPDGRLYFADQNNKKAVAFDTVAQQFSVYSIPAPNTGVAGTAFGADGNAYIVGPANSAIYRMTTAGVFLPRIQLLAGRYPHGPSGCADGNVWFAEMNANRVAKVDVLGNVTEILLPQGSSQPFSTACGPDGVYFTEQIGKIGRVDYTTLQITQWQTANTKSRPTGIAVSNGNVYFAETAIGMIGVMPVGGGAIVESTIPLRGVFPDKLTAGGDGRVWFSQQYLAEIAAIN